MVIIGYWKEGKNSKVKQDVFENIANAIKTIGKCRKKDTSVAHRIIQTLIISSSTRKNVWQHKSQELLKLHRKYCTNITNFDYK